MQIRGERTRRVDLTCARQMSVYFFFLFLCEFEGFTVCKSVGVLRVMKSVMRVVESVILRYG